MVEINKSSSKLKNRKAEKSDHTIMTQQIESIDEITHILSFLPLDHILNCELVCQNWKMAVDSYGWEDMYRALNCFWMFSDEERKDMIERLSQKLSSSSRIHLIKRIVIPKLTGIRLSSAQVSSSSSALIVSPRIVKQISTRATNKTTAERKYDKRSSDDDSCGISIQMWFKLSGEDPFSGGVLFGVQNEEFSSGAAFVPVLYVTTENVIRANFWTNGRHPRERRSDREVRLEPDTMYHVCIVGDRRGVRAYINGQLFHELATKRVDMMKHQLFYGQIGSGLCDRWPDTRMNYFYNCYTFAGSIYDIQIYKRALSGEEVRETMWTKDVIEPEARLTSWCMFPSEQYLSSNTTLTIRNDVSLLHSKLINYPTSRNHNI